MVKYPCVFRWHSGLEVEFTSLRAGTVKVQGDSSSRVGTHRSDWIEHTDSQWEQIGSKRRNLHSMVRSFNVPH